MRDGVRPGFRFCFPTEPRRAGTDDPLPGKHNRQRRHAFSALQFVAREGLPRLRRKSFFGRIMKIRLGRKFWMAATAVIVVLTAIVVGRNALHAAKIKRQINALERERDRYRARIAQDSTLLERLRYDDYLEEYARENYRMQRRDEHVYIVEE